MEQYHRLLKEILERGDVQFEERTQEHILGLSAWQSRYDLGQGFPLITTKNVPPRLPFEELFWKLRGERNVKGLIDRNVHIWNANAFDRHLKTQGLRDEIPKHSQRWNEMFTEYVEKLKQDPTFTTEGDLGPVYGFQWRHWGTADGGEVDQLSKLLESIKTKPGSRYHVLSSWNVGDLPEMALGPCPFWHQFSVFGENIDLTTVQRSCDVFLGVPFNIAQDSLLTHLVAQETGFAPRTFNHSYINVHAYLGVPPRSDFWESPENVAEFQRRFGEVAEREEYLGVREWYLGEAPPESEGNERKDHVPFILAQLSKTPRTLPTLEVKRDVPLIEAIERPPLEIVGISGYDPEKWDSRASMAA